MDGDPQLVAGPGGGYVKSQRAALGTHPAWVEQFSQPELEMLRRVRALLIPVVHPPREIVDQALRLFRGLDSGRLEIIGVSDPVVGNDGDFGRVVFRIIHARALLDPVGDIGKSKERLTGIEDRARSFVVVAHLARHAVPPETNQRVARVAIVDVHLLNLGIFGSGRPHVEGGNAVLGFQHQFGAGLRREIEVIFQVTFKPHGPGRLAGRCKRMVVMRRQGHTARRLRRQRRHSPEDPFGR